MQLDKLRLDTRKEEVRLMAARGGLDPQIVIKKPSCNKGGVPEKLIMVSPILISYQKCYTRVCLIFLNVEFYGGVIVDNLLVR